MTYEVIKEYYNKGLFKDTDLELFVSCGWLSNEQKLEIINT